MTKDELEKQIRAIIFDDEFEILGKVKFKNDVAVGPQVEQFKVDSLIVLIGKLLNDQRITNLKRQLDSQTWFIEKIGPILEQADQRRVHLEELVKKAKESV